MDTQKNTKTKKMTTSHKKNVKVASRIKAGGSGAVGFTAMSVK